MIAKYLCHKLNYDIDQTTANDLFCIGTVADMAPLIGANRKWLKDCLPTIKNSKNPGIRTIIKKLAIDETEISSDDIGYKIAPLINAVGRIGNPKLIVEFLTETSESSIKKLALQIFSLHKQRKRMTSIIEDEAVKMAAQEYASNSKFIVLENRDWHPGIIGIVAARIVDKYNLPTALLSLANDGTFRGSIR